MNTIFSFTVTLMADIRMNMLTQMDINTLKNYSVSIQHVNKHFFFSIKFNSKRISSFLLGNGNDVLSSTIVLSIDT